MRRFACLKRAISCPTKCPSNSPARSGTSSMPEVLARGLRFNVLTLGTGTPVVVCIHGFVLDNHSSFYMTLAPALARVAQVVLYDLRGHGLSEQPRSGYTIDDATADLAAILDTLQLNGRPVVLLGHSLGGY